MPVPEIMKLEHISRQKWCPAAGFPIPVRSYTYGRNIGKNSHGDCHVARKWAHAPPPPPPPTGPNSFIFAYIFAEKHPRRRSTPPLTGPRPPTGNPGSATDAACIFTFQFTPSIGSLSISTIMNGHTYQFPRL